ncbi:hypothetical protein M9Y10_027830 [Tritrichomonas musculus]|uniref:Surface antigen BspA-like n=1 Tax=Tritrichomonas musculus TaxID=1915356 RepID=A0ABR2H562_9EUKA
MSSFLPSIEEFNHLPVESQQIIISSQLINNASGEEKANLAKVLNLMEYLNENNDQGSEHLFSILYQNKEKSLEKVIFQINEIELSRQATKTLNSKDRLNSAEFKNLLSNFETVSLEIEYPSSVFDIIYNQLLNLKTEVSTKPKIIISVYINGIEQKTDKKFIKNGNIGIIRFGKTVKTITEGRSHDQGSFFCCSSLTLISIPSSVTSIGDYAFRDCLRLTQIEFEFPSSVASIGDFAFYNCLRLTQITIPSSVTSIGRCAFHFCRSLTQVTIPSSVTSIGDYAFLDCLSLAQIEFEFPSFLASIGRECFKCCSSLTQVTIPSSVTSIGDYAFLDCLSLAQIEFEFPSSLASIGRECFKCCSSLTKISIPSSVTSIGRDAFYDCLSLAQITFEFPSSLASIGRECFKWCSSLTKISIPSSVTSIGRDAFFICSSLLIISIPLKGCSSLYSIFRKRMKLGINNDAQICDLDSIFLNAFMNVSSLSYEIGYINQASAPFFVRKALKDIFSIAVSIEYNLFSISSQKNEHQSPPIDFEEKLQNQKKEFEIQQKEFEIQKKEFEIRQKEFEIQKKELENQMKLMLEKMIKQQDEVEKLKKEMFEKDEKYKKEMEEKDETIQILIEKLKVIQNKS